MKRSCAIQTLVLPLLLAFLIILPLLCAAVIGEHRYERTHPAYVRHFMMRLIGEEQEDGDEDLPTALDGGRVNVLVVGKDRAAGLTDVMMLASLDTKENKLDLLQIPRDTYANYTNQNYKKINGAYAKLGGAGLARFLSENLGVAVDHYICVDLDVLGEMVDMMGGVRMNVPADMDYDDPAQNLHIHIKAGEQMLDGKAAQSFVRFRSGYAQADVGRMDAQKIFLSALAKGAKDNLSLSQTVSLVCRCIGKVKTDMNLSDCIEYVKHLRSVDLAKLNMATLPGASARTDGNSGAWYYILNRDATAALIERTVGAKGAFDPGRVFDRADKAAFHRIYSAAAEGYGVHEYTAEGALGGEVAIKRIG